MGLGKLKIEKRWSKNKSSTDWRLVVVKNHFHKFDYLCSVPSLDLLIL